MFAKSNQFNSSQTISRFWYFSSIFVYLFNDLSGNTIWPQANHIQKMGLFELFSHIPRFLAVFVWLTIDLSGNTVWPLFCYLFFSKNRNLNWIPNSKNRFFLFFLSFAKVSHIQQLTFTKILVLCLEFIKITCDLTHREDWFVTKTHIHTRAQRRKSPRGGSRVALAKP